jgi:hypothetical protein
MTSILLHCDFYSLKSRPSLCNTTRAVTQWSTSQPLLYDNAVTPQHHQGHDKESIKERVERANRAAREDRSGHHQ